MASINLSSQLIISIIIFYFIAAHINGDEITATTESDQTRTVSTELLSSQGAYKVKQSIFFVLFYHMLQKEKDYRFFLPSFN